MFYSSDIDTESGIALIEEKGAIPTMHFYQYELSACLDPTEVLDGEIMPGVDLDLAEKQVTRREVY